MYTQNTINSNVLQKRTQSFFERLIKEKDICELSEQLTMKWMLCAAFCSLNNLSLFRDFEKGFAYIQNNMQKNFDSCTFVPYLSEVFMRYAGNQMSAATKGYLEKISLDAIEYSLQDCWDFIGVNDNTPAMIMTFLFLAGERWNDKRCTVTASKRLGQYEELLESRRFVSEFNSQTYHAINITAMAMLAEYTTDDAIKKRALKCEEKLWEQVFLMYHRDSGLLSGPYSRSYRTNSLAKTSQMTVLLYIILGENNPINRMDLMYENAEDFICLIAETGLFSAAQYHCPKSLIEMCMAEKYPITIFGDTQIAASADDYLVKELDVFKKTEVFTELMKQESMEEYPAGTSKIMAYKNKYYTLGTCTKEFHNGVQTDSFHSVVCDNSPIKAESEITAIFARYFINNEDISLDMGRKIAFQHENTALVCYTPKTYTQEIFSLKLSILIGNTDNFEIYCDKKNLRLGDELNSDKPIVFKFKSVYAAVILFKREDIKIEEIDGCLAVSFINYSGKPQRFTKKALKMINEGFVFEIRNKEECKSIEEFNNSISKSECSDILYANIHTRYAMERRVSYKNGNKKLSCLYSPVSEGIEYIRINEKNII